MNNMQRAGQFFTGILFLALASGLILSGCNDDEATFSDIMGTSPSEAPASSIAALPEWSDMQKAVSFSAVQIDPMRESYDFWRNSDSGREGTMDFLKQSQDVLDRDQFIALVGYLGDRAERDREDRRAAMSRRSGSERGPRGGGGSADHDWSRGGRSGESLGELAEELGLTAEQKEQIQATFASHREEMEALQTQRRAGTLSHDEFRAAHDALRARNHEAMVAALTEEQAAAFAASQAARRAERMQERLEQFDESDSDAKKIAFLTDVLDLDAAQSAELASLFAERHAARRTRLEEAIVSAGTETGPRDRDGHREAMREAHDEMNAAIQSILNDDQLEVYDALQTLHRMPGGKGAPGHVRGHGDGPHGRR